MVVDMEVEACTSKKSEGNAAYADGDLPLAATLYADALSLWEKALEVVAQPKILAVGALVEYSRKGYYGTVMSAYTQFDEYFLKDLGSDKPIWVGDAGGTLRRFARKEIRAVPQEMLDLRFATVQNLAAVCLKQEEFGEAERWADAALVINGRAPKALMRKGAALLRLGKPGPASDALATAVEVAPNDGECKKLLREAEMKRSPTWVCVTGCCGPWGIVCGGPVASVMPQVVPPAAKKAEIQEAGDAFEDSVIATGVDASTTATVESELKDVTTGDCRSCDSSSSGSAPSTPRKGAEANEQQKGNAFGFKGLGDLGDLEPVAERPAAQLRDSASRKTPLRIDGHNTTTPTTSAGDPSPQQGKKPQSADAVETTTRSVQESKQGGRIDTCHKQKASASWIPFAVLPITVLLVAVATAWALNAFGIDSALA